MWGSLTAVWAICFASVQPTVSAGSLPSRPDRDRASLALEDSTEASSWSTDEVECFSGYMTLWIPRLRLVGLKRWLGQVLHVPGTWREPSHLDPLLAKCGYSLHPTPNGDFIFRVQYSACFVQKETANYRLEIRIFQKGVKRLERSDRYVMRCPRIQPGLGWQSIRCSPKFMQVSRPLPFGSDGGRMPWLLSLRGELVTSLEDAGLMGLSVDINATTVTVQSLRQDLLQRREVLNTSVELLPLWLLGGPYAYSLEAACPLGWSPSASEVFIHVPKQRLGLVKRGSRIKGTLGLRFLRVHQSDTYTVTENRDFVVVGIPAAGLLNGQYCQVAQGIPGMQASYRVDLSLQFTEMETPVLWTLESTFPCVGEKPITASFLEGSGMELPVLTTVSGIAPSTPSPGLESPLAGVLPAASSQLAVAGPAAREGLSQGPEELLPDVSVKQGLGQFLPAARPTGGSWASTASLTPQAIEDELGPQAPWGEAGLPGPPPPPTTLSPEPLAASNPPPPGSPDTTALTLPLSSEVFRPLSAPSELPKAFLGWGPSVARTEGLTTEGPWKDPAQSAGSPLLQGGWSGQVVAASEDLSSKDLQSLVKASVASLTEEVLVPCHSPAETQKAVSLPSVDLASPEPSQDIQGLGHTSLRRLEVTDVTPRVRWTDLRAKPGTSLPQPTGKPKVSPAAHSEKPLASSRKPTALTMVRSSHRMQGMKSIPRWLQGQDVWGAVQTSSSSSLQALSPWAPAEASVPSVAGPRDRLSTGHRTLAPQKTGPPTWASSSTSAPETGRPTEGPCGDAGGESQECPLSTPSPCSRGCTAGSEGSSDAR